MAMGGLGIERAEDVAESVVHVLEAPDNVEMPELVLRRFSSV